MKIPRTGHFRVIREKILYLEKISFDILWQIDSDEKSHIAKVNTFLYHTNVFLFFNNLCMKKYLVPIALISATLLLAGCFHVKSEIALPSQTEPKTIQPIGSSASDLNTKVNVQVAETHRIDMTADGFSPSEVTVKAGDTVNFVNTDTETHWPASAIHPTHQLLPGFDAIGGVSAGSTYAYTFTKVGTWPFHDHLHASSTGKVIVF